MSISTQNDQALRASSDPELTKAAAAPVVANTASSKPAKKDKNASMEAFSVGLLDQEQDLSEGASAEELRNAAVEEAKRYQIAREAHEDDADRASWTLIRLMLRVVESFERLDGDYDEPAFQQFLADNGAAPRKNAASDFHRLAKACTPRGMKSSRVSKFGGVITALRRREIQSSNVLTELNKRESVKEGGPLHFGAHRFFLLYQEDKKEQEDRNKPEEESGNPYKAWPRPKLVREGKLLLEALFVQGLVPSEYEGLEAYLQEQSE